MLFSLQSLYAVCNLYTSYAPSSSPSISSPSSEDCDVDEYSSLCGFNSGCSIQHLSAVCLSRLFMHSSWSQCLFLSSGCRIQHLSAGCLLLSFFTLWLTAGCLRISSYDACRQRFEIRRRQLSKL